MAKVTIYTKDGGEHEVTASPEEEKYYDDLPFTDPNVVATTIRSEG